MLLGEAAFEARVEDNERILSSKHSSAQGALEGGRRDGGQRRGCSEVR